MENGNPDDDLITFMHYSFLEYYAAAGLLVTDFIASLPKLSGNPRWKDVATLLFGILSEQGDVTRPLEALLQNQTRSESISGLKLLLALDCAAECDVPPEAAQEIVVEHLVRAMNLGVGRFSESFRGELASRLERMLEGSSRKVEQALCDSLGRDVPPVVSAAFVDLISRIPERYVVSERLVVAFKDFLKQDLPIARIANLHALETRQEFRGEEAFPALLAALSGNLAEKLAALKLITYVPAYYEQCSKRVIDALGSSDGLVSASAAQCILACTFSSQAWTLPQALQERVMSRLGSIDDDRRISLTGVTLDTRQIDTLLASPKGSEFELGLRFMPLIRHDPQFVYQRLSSILRTDAAPRVLAASLDSLRTTPQVLDLITIADTDMICGHAGHSERNIRRAAIRLLGEMPDDEQVVRTLLDRLYELRKLKSDGEEISAVARALSNHARKSPRLRADVISAKINTYQSLLKSALEAPNNSSTWARLSLYAMH